MQFAYYTEDGPEWEWWGQSAPGPYQPPRPDNRPIVDVPLPDPKEGAA